MDGFVWWDGWMDRCRWMDELIILGGWKDLSGMMDG